MDEMELCLESELTKHPAERCNRTLLESELTKYPADESIELCLESELTKVPVKRDPLQIRM